MQDGNHFSGPVQPARIPMRIVSGLEVASVVVSVLITTWAIIPSQPPQRWMIALPGLLSLALILNSHRVRGESLRELGLGSRHFARAIKLLALPTLVVCAIFLAIGYTSNSFHRTSNFWMTTLFLPVWGTFQQYILQGFIYRRVRSLMVDEVASAADQKRRVALSNLLTAAIFCLVHAPNPALTLLTLVGGLIWTWVYERAPNLVALGLSHGLMSLVLMTTLPSWVLQSMSVGYKHFLYQKF